MGSDESAAETAQSGQDGGSDPSREQGIDFGSLADELDSHSYPATTREIVDEYGDHEVDLPNGSKTLEEILGDLQDEDQEYDSAEEVRQMVFNMVGSDAVGREGYSDRGGVAGDSDSNAAEQSNPEGESF